VSKEVIMVRCTFRFVLIALLFTMLGSTLWAQNAGSEQAYDVVIFNGRVVDGTGGAWFYGDVAIRGARIARITPAGLLREAPARARIEAHGLVVAPGFIDIQSHSRGAFLTGDGRVISKVTQGITTEIMGEGWTNAPANDNTVSLAGSVDPEERNLTDRFRGPRSFANWLEAMQEHGTSANFGSFLGATTVRTYVKATAEGPPTAYELEEMRQLVRNAMEEGAFGIATALIYPPGNFAAIEELIELSKAMAPYGGVYITHMRSEADKYLEAIDEALQIGRKGEVPVEIYHLKAAGRRNWYKARLAVAKIEAARAEGQDVGADMYPYIAGGTGLAACLPPWASAEGKLFDNLEDPAMRAEIKNEVLEQKMEWENLCMLATPDGVVVSGLRQPANKPLVGKRLSEIAAEQGKNWVDATMDLILSERQSIGSLFFLMTEENLKLQMRQPWIKFGTDAGGVDPDNPRGPAHPRAYGTYPRILGKYVREERVMTLEEAVRKMSSAVAGRLSIQDRGLLREGMYADIVIFDLNTIGDRATFEQPHQLSVGMRHVFVNGVAVVKDGNHTGAKPGRIVRGPGYARD
jgi:dihydroorotase/N-acyl-D-amino-acid deacylase